MFTQYCNDLRALIKEKKLIVPDGPITAVHICVNSVTTRTASEDENETHLPVNNSYADVDVVRHTVHDIELLM